MNINKFKLEEYLSQYEFTSPYLLCSSDAESFSMHEILSLADKEDKDLWENLRLGYTETYGLPKLRKQIATSLFPSLSDNNILCFAGAEEGIFASLYALCQPEDHAIILTPCYQSLLEVPKLKGADVTEVPLKEENQWRINLEDIQKSIKKNTKWVIINFPHNPTGQVISEEELKSLTHLCDKHGLWLFSDEVYRLLGTPSDGWAKPAAETYSKAISLGVTSKAFGLAGLRVGWIACQDTQMLQQIKQMKDYLSICNSAPAEIISLIALKNKDFILKRNNQILDDNLLLLDQFMLKYQEKFRWVRPQGGCVGFVEYKSTESVDHFSARLVKEKGVLLLPASNYDYNKNYFRIGFGRKNMPEALHRLEEFIQSNC
ncbi:MAG: aminotransferase class I/II-fold pyridoxal phosphate-dependent enzyme [Candidatus Paracaedibacteraceae bacterium]|nr:aminotransferase class I/II-fold pyridoxal phosphate-dependent enzyme [Candidatus Paracaedibacteraceae bacterium]